MQVKNQLCYLNASPWLLLKNTTLILLPAILILLAYDLFESAFVAHKSEELLQLYGYSQPFLILFTAFAVALSVTINRAIVKLVHIRKKGLLSNFLIGIAASSVLTLVVFLCLSPLLELFGLNEWLRSLPAMQRVEFNQQITLFLQTRIGAVFALVIIWQVSSALRALNDLTCSSLYFLLWMSSKFVVLVWVIYQSPESVLANLGTMHFIIDISFAVIGCALLFHRHPMAWLSPPKVSKYHADNLLIMFQQLVPALSVALITYLATQVNSTFISVFALTYKIEAMTLLVPMVLTATLPALVGTNYWSSKKARAMSLLLQAFHLIIVTQIILSLILYLFQSTLFSLVCPDCAQAFLLTQYIYWLPISYVGLGLSMVLVSSLNAIGRTRQATSLLCLHRLLLCPFLVLIGIVLFAEKGIFMGLATANVISGMIAYYYVNHSLKSDTLKQTSDIDQNLKFTA